MTSRERFESLFHRLMANVSPIPWIGCFMWTGSLKPNGYAQIGVNGKTTYGHRVMYELVKGPIPQGLVIDHLCGNRWCVNPDHLEAVKQQINAARGKTGKYERTECKNGHPYSLGVFRLTKKGVKQCLFCARACSKRTRARKKGETQ